MSEKFSDAPVVKEFTKAVEQVGPIISAQAGKPTQEDIIQTLMVCYNQRRDVIISWLRELKL